MPCPNEEKLDLRSRLWLFFLAPGLAYCWLVSRLFGIGWTGPDADFER